jgi:hypothetical protein
MIAVNRARVFSRQSRRFVLTKVGECLYRSDCGSYFGVVTHRGKQHRHCLQTKDRDVARKKLGEFRQQLCAPSLPEHAADPAAAITFDQLAEQWLEATRYSLKPSSARLSK